MASTYIPALVIKHNNDVFFNVKTLVAGLSSEIPTPGAGGRVDGDFWAIPITDNGIVSGFNFLPCNPTDVAPPATVTNSAQCFHAFRLTTQLGNDSWYCRGKTTGTDNGSPATWGYIQAASDAECCSATPRVLPTDLPVFAPCQPLCYWNASNLYFAMFALPTLTGQNWYFPYGYFNNVLLPAAARDGYQTPTTLLTFLNSGAWGAIGTWSYADAPANTRLQVVQSAGSGLDVLCAVITVVNASS